MEEANDSQGGVHPFSFFLFLFSQTRATDTRLKTRAHVNSPPFLHPSSPPPLPSRRFLSRKRENVVVQKLLCRVPPGVYDLSLAPHFFLSIFLPRSSRHAVSTPTQTRQRSVHEWNSSNCNAPPCASPSLPSWEKSEGVGSRSFHGFHGYTELRLLFFRSLEPRFISIRYGAFIESKGGG